MVQDLFTRGRAFLIMPYYHNSDQQRNSNSSSLSRNERELLAGHSVKVPQFWTVSCFGPPELRLVTYWAHCKPHLFSSLQLLRKGWQRRIYLQPVFLRYFVILICRVGTRSTVWAPVITLLEFEEINKIFKWTITYWACVIWSCFKIHRVFWKCIFFRYSCKNSANEKVIYYNLQKVRRLMEKYQCRLRKWIVLCHFESN